ncbi:aminotransferase class V-fold PLP-dependent enzyme [Streptomyces collinus]|uniref:aminotransferase class V-fold PLP-dependent enzyme n=1 Tax=Streptomyces collinus TaxID=42684 RepID=UPI003649ECE2
MKAELAGLIDCDPGEIALNRNSTEGLCTAVFGIPLAAGDQVVISPWDYPSVRAAWLRRQEREGVEVVTADCDLMDGDDEIYEAYAAVLTPRTRVLQITHMSHWTGRVVRARRLCRPARDNGTVTVVDGAQTFAQMPVSFRDLGCDFFVTSLHKWMGAPVGNGMLVVREGVIDRTWPLPAPFGPPPLRVDKFDHWNLGTYNSVLQAGILPAARFHGEIGAEAVHARVRELTRYWVERVRGIPGFTLHTPVDTDILGAVSLFSIDGLDSGTVEEQLRDEHRIQVKYREVRQLSGMRVSPHIYMRESELDRFVEALAEVVDKQRARP